MLVDRKYILAAMGILSTEYPQTALRIMKKGVSKKMETIDIKNKNGPMTNFIKFVKRSSLPGKPVRK